jgi:hypothetical protein
MVFNPVFHEDCKMGPVIFVPFVYYKLLGMKLRVLHLDRLQAALEALCTSSNNVGFLSFLKFARAGIKPVIFLFIFILFCHFTTELQHLHRGEFIYI